MVNLKETGLDSSKGIVHLISNKNWSKESKVEYLVLECSKELEKIHIFEDINKVQVLIEGSDYELESKNNKEIVLTDKTKRKLQVMLLKTSINKLDLHMVLDGMLKGGVLPSRTVLDYYTSSI